MTDIPVRFRGDSRDAQAAIKALERELAGIQTTVEKQAVAVEGFGKRAASALSLAGKAAAGLGIAFGAQQLVGKVGDAVKAASSLNEEIAKSQQVFKGAAVDVVSWSKTTTDAFGISQRAALEFTGVFGNMLVPMGIAREKAAEMSRQMVELAGDMASFNNASPEEVLEALRSGLAGEAEPLRRFGVFLDEARIRAEALSQGLEVGTGTLDAQTRALGAYGLILKDTGDAQGDVARTSDSFANQQRRLGAELEDVSAKIGRVLIPALADLTAAANDVIDPLIQVGDALGKAFSLGFLPDARDLFDDREEWLKEAEKTGKELGFESADAYLESLWAKYRVDVAPTFADVQRATDPEAAAVGDSAGRTMAEVMSDRLAETLARVFPPAVRGAIAPGFREIQDVIIDDATELIRRRFPAALVDSVAPAFDVVRAYAAQAGIATGTAFAQNAVNIAAAALSGITLGPSTLPSSSGIPGLQRGASIAERARAAAQAAAEAAAAAQDAIDRGVRDVPSVPTTRSSAPPPRSTGPTPAQQQVTGAVRWALDQQGLPYVWGGGHGPGVGPDYGAGEPADRGQGPGFDCSGLIHDAYQKVGVSVPPTAEAWSTWPHKVPSVAALQPGDVIQCNNRGHVVLYIGNGQVVAASGGRSGGGNDKVLIQGIPGGITGLFRPIPGATVDASIIDQTVEDTDPGDVPLPRREQKAVRRSVSSFRDLVAQANAGGLLGTPIKRQINAALKQVGALVRDGITENEADKIKALLDPLDAELDKRLEKQKERIRKALDDWRDLIADKRSAVADAFGTVLDGVSKVFDAKTARILDTFDDQTRELVEKARATVTAGGVTFETGAGEETPAERQLRLRREAKETEDAADAIARARQRLEEARRGRLVTVKGVSIDLATGRISETESQQQVADAQEIADAQKALDDLLFDQETRAIERQAELERKAADDALEARRKAIEDARELERAAIEDERELARSRMEERVNGIIDAIKAGDITAAEGQRQLIDTLTAFDGDWADAGGLLGSAFAEAFNKAILAITPIVRDATLVEQNQPPSAPPTAPAKDKPPPKPTKRTSFRWFGETWTKPELDAFKEALADHGADYETWRKRNPELAVVFAAQGGVMMRRQLVGVVGGEAGAEALLPLTNPRAMAMIRDALGGAGGVHHHWGGVTVLGASSFEVEEAIGRMAREAERRAVGYLSPN